MAKAIKKELTLKRTQELLKILASRFEKNIHRHKDLDWKRVQLKLERSPEKLWSLNEMEITGGEPDIIHPFQDREGKIINAYFFVDCSSESPAGRRSLCYDHDALMSRKENKPKNSAINSAALMGIELLSEVQYRQMHNFGKFDAKTSSWVKTPESIRELGGALFCDFRFNHVFVYHNGAESYYAARGFRGYLII